MVPKFRGDSEDWLDDEASQLRKKKFSPKPRDKRCLDHSKATVMEVFPNQCRVRMHLGGTEALCTYRRASLVGSQKLIQRERTLVAVGDEVFVQLNADHSGVIEGVSPRKNALFRPAPGRETNPTLHVLAANVDFVVIVASAHCPEFSPGLVDRFLIATEAAGLSPLICITKMDLVSVDQPKPWQLYQELNYPVLELSLRPLVGIRELEQKIDEKTAVFCGHSGVGKTSLFRELLKEQVGKVGVVNEITGKGQHTTTGAILFQKTLNSKWIDTPGIREFGLAHLSSEELAQYFPEFKSLECNKYACLHWNEPNCFAQELPRYHSYRRIFESLKNLKLG